MLFVIFVMNFVNSKLYVYLAMFVKTNSDKYDD